MALHEIEVKDFMRGRSQETITLRYDSEDFIKLKCHCEYDPALCGRKGNFVLLFRKIEVKNSDGTWSPYPSVSWLDGIESDEQFQTRAFVKITDKEGSDIMASTDGVPDMELVFEAENAGIYTERIG